MNITNFILRSDGYYIDGPNGDIYTLNDDTLTNITNGTIYFIISPAFIINTKTGNVEPFFNQCQSVQNFWSTRYPSGLTGTTNSDTQITVNWTNNGSGYDTICLERSSNNQNDFIEIAFLSEGVSSYVNSGLTQGTSYYYRIRYQYSQNFYGYSPYCGQINNWTASNLSVSKTGTGAGVATIRLIVGSDCIMTSSNNGYFYSNSAGTLDPTQSLTITGGTYNVVYFKLTSGNSNLLIYHNGDWTRLSGSPYGWDSSTNAPSLDILLSDLPECLEYFSCSSNNTISGSVNDLPRSMLLIYLVGTSTYITGNTSQIPRNMTSITLTRAGLTGDIKDFPPNIAYIYLTTSAAASGPLVITGNVKDLPRTVTGAIISGSSTFGGDLADLPINCYKFVSYGFGTYYGDVSVLPTPIYYFGVNSTTLSGMTYTNGIKTWYQPYQHFDLYCPSQRDLDTTVCDNICIDLSPLTWGGTSKVITISGHVTSASASARTTLASKGVSVVT